VKTKPLMRRSEPLKDGQTVRDVQLVRRIRTQKTFIRKISEPKPLSCGVAEAFGRTVDPIIEANKFRDKVVGVEQERFRWLKPIFDNAGNCIGTMPREAPVNA
jgi:hypothetical protein